MPMHPPYVEIICACAVLTAFAVALDATVGRLPILLPRPPPPPLPKQQQIKLDHKTTTAPPPYVRTVCVSAVLVASAVALDATVARLYLLPVLPRPPQLPRRARYPTPAEATEAAALRRRRLCCAVAAAVQGALALALEQHVMAVPGLALQALAVAALGATAACLLTEIRLIEIVVAAAGLRRFTFARAFVAVLRAAVRVAAVVGFAAAVWMPDE